MSDDDDSDRFSLLHGLGQSTSLQTWGHHSFSHPTVAHRTSVKTSDPSATSMNAGHAAPLTVGAQSTFFGSPQTSLVPFTIDFGGQGICVYLDAAQRPIVRHRVKALLRAEKRRAASAQIAASTAQQIGIGLGGSLGVAGLVASLTVAAPLVAGAALAAGAGGLILVAGMVSSYTFNSRKLEHEERVDRYNDALEEIR